MKHSHLSACLGLLLISSACAFPEFVNQFPNGDAGFNPGTGITCQHLGHQNCVIGAPRNEFGQDWDDNGRKWDKALCEMDSDGDGLTNGEELGDPCCEWTADNPTDLRLDQLSHPGVAAEDGARSAPGCGQAQPGGTTTPTTTQATTAASTTTTTTPPPSAAGTTTATTAAPTTASSSTASSAATAPTPTEPTPTVTEPTPPAPTPTAPTSSDATPTATPDDDDDAVCFPAHATVQLQTGNTKRMDQVQIGDRVHVGGGHYSEVFLFTHKISDVQHQFVTLRTGTAENVEASISLTKGHFIYANGNLVTADQVKIGDTLELQDGQVSSVVHVACATFKGLYNPQTAHGDIMVDGVRVSTYTEVVNSRLAHSLLAPLRAMYRWMGWSPRALEKGAPSIVRILS